MFMWLLLYNSHSLRRKKKQAFFFPTFLLQETMTVFILKQIIHLIRRNVKDLDVWREMGCNAQYRKRKSAAMLPIPEFIGGGRLRPACLCLFASEMGYSALWDVLICTNEITSGLNLQRYRTQITKPWKVPETLREFHLNSNSFFFF